MTSRRTLLAAGAAGVAGVVSAAAGGVLAAPAPAAAAAPLVSSDQVSHLLRRATFGPTPGTLAEAKRLGVAGWLAKQLDPATIDDAACDALLARLPLANADIPTVRATLPVHSYDAFGQLGRAAVARAAWSKRQLFEATVAFWANHLHIAAPSSGVWDSRGDYDRQVIRKHAFGTFADMLKASATHPAMLTYLDNRTSTKSRPNENYARELMELHTVGMIYREDEVQAAARLLTGLTVTKVGTYTYDPARHVTGAVKIVGFGHANATAAGGEAAALAFVDHLARHPETARRIATKLCVRFVADQPPAALVARLTKVYLDNGTAIKPVLTALFTSAEFAAAIGQKTRTPFEDMIATVRALGLGPEKSGIKGLDALYQTMVKAGNAPFRWNPPNGFPDVAAAWSAPAGFLIRCNMHLNLATGWYPSQLTRPADMQSLLVPEGSGFAAPTGGLGAGGSGAPVLPATYGALVDALAVRLVGSKLPAAHTAAVLSVAAKLPTSPLTATDKSLAGHLPYLVALVLDSPSFQLR
jgi:uncharacterized protein (DUF1800 family)